MSVLNTYVIQDHGVRLSARRVFDGDVSAILAVVALQVLHRVARYLILSAFEPDARKWLRDRAAATQARAVKSIEEDCLLPNILPHVSNLSGVFRFQ